jgi:hypothetical protein
MANKHSYAFSLIVPNGKGKSFMKFGRVKVAVGSIIYIGMLLAGLSLANDNSTGEILISTPEQFDAGTVAEGKTIEVTTSVQNMGNSPVEITNVRTS